jgi:hypothetical protein
MPARASVLAVVEVVAGEMESLLGICSSGYGSHVAETHMGDTRLRRPSRHKRKAREDLPSRLAARSPGVAAAESPVEAQIRNLARYGQVAQEYLKFATRKVVSAVYLPLR